MTRVRAAVEVGFRWNGDRARAMVRARTAARMAVSRQGNCRKASSGAWVQKIVVRGVRRRVMTMVRIVIGKSRRWMMDGIASHPSPPQRAKALAGDSGSRYDCEGWGTR